MGTRNITMVTMNAETKVAQYGQWDGYPDGQGEIVLKFILDELIEKKRLSEFKKKLNVIEFISDKSIPPEKVKNAEFDRDTGAGVLYLIMDREITQLVNEEDFIKDTLFCEWFYRIDLDNNKLIVGGGLEREYYFSELGNNTMKELQKSYDGKQD